MRYMHKKLYFNKLELQELERCNPTLFELAQYVADKAHITVKVMGENWASVSEGDNIDYDKLLCPSEVFHVPGTKLDSGDPACPELRCWAMYNEPSENPDKPYRPCWFRHWNDFVNNQKAETKEKED